MDYLLFIAIRTYFRYNKINKALYYGLKGTAYTGAFDIDRDKILILKKHRQQYKVSDSYGYSHTKLLPYSGIIDVYDNETLEYIRSVSEDELWDMIKERTGEEGLIRKKVKYCQYSILSGDLCYNGEYLKYHKMAFADLMKNSTCPYCGKSSAEIKYAFVGFNRESLIFYNTCCKQANKFIEQLMKESTKKMDDIKS